MLGGGGDDILDGGGSGILEFDFLVGGFGNDMINGQTGDDVVFGGPGNDQLDGGDGDDHLESEEGNDTFHGGPGNDTIFGGADDDQLFGEDGDDELHGEGGVDQLYGGQGDDVLYGGLGVDVLDGGAGTNSLIEEDDNHAPTDLQLVSVSLPAGFARERILGATIGRLFAADADLDQLLSFSVSDARFEVIGNLLKLRSSEFFDQNDAHSIEFEISVTDTGTPPLTTRALVQLNIQANPAPWQYYR